MMSQSELLRAKFQRAKELAKRFQRTETAKKLAAAKYWRDQIDEASLGPNAGNPYYAAVRRVANKDKVTWPNSQLAKDEAGLLQAWRSLDAGELRKYADAIDAYKARQRPSSEKGGGPAKRNRYEILAVHRRYPELSKAQVWDKLNERRERNHVRVLVRKAYPKATAGEIDNEVDRRIAVLRKQNPSSPAWTHELDWAQFRRESDGIKFPPGKPGRKRST